MLLKFVHLHIRDFKSFVGEHELHLDLPPGVHFVRGRNRDEKRLGANGTGKSTLWDALVWCLYGRTPAGLRNPDVTPWQGPRKGTRVSVVLEIDGRRMVVTRSVSPNRLQINDKDVGPEAVVELIGMSFDVLVNTIVLGQGRSLFFDLTPMQKMQLLSDVKNLERWDERSKRAADAAQALQQRHLDMIGRQKGLERTIAEINAAINELRPKEEEWQREYEARLARVQNFEVRNGARLVELQRKADDADLVYDGAMTEVKGLEKEERERADAFFAARSQFERIKADRIRVNEQLQQAKAHLRELRQARTCPTCGQPVNQNGGIAHHRADTLRQIKLLERQLTELEAQSKQAKGALVECRRLRERAASNLERFHVKADAALRDLKAAQHELAVLQAEKRQLERAAMDDAANPHSKNIRMLRKRRTALRMELDQLVNEAVQCEKQMVCARFWIKGFREIKLHVIEELLQELELCTASMLEEVGLVGWRIKYDIERETKAGTTQRALSVMIGSPRSKGKLVKWEAWSGGEGQRLRVVGALALASVLLGHARRRPNIEILDEPTQHLSDEGIRDLCDMLAERAKLHGRCIFYCDHQSVDGAAFMSTITVRRTALGSQIVI